MRSEQPTPPPPWERKDRKLERGGSGSGSTTGDAPPGASGSASVSASACASAPVPTPTPTPTPRWRDLRYGGPVPHDSPRRPPSGHNRIYPEDSPSQSERPYTEDEKRHGRDSRNPFRRSPTLNVPSNLPSRPSYDTSMLTATRSLSIPVSTSSTTQPSSKGYTDKDHSLAPLSWKPLKWARPSGGSSLSKEETTLKVLVPPVKETSFASPITSPLVGDENGAFRKKARLGWGQGLAKYEKEKVQGSVDSSSTRSGGPGDTGNSGAFEASIGGAGDTGATMHIRAATCLSPVTPLSATSRPPAIEDEKQCTGTAIESTDGNTSHQNVVEPANRPCSQDFPIKLDFSVNSFSSFSTLLANLLQPEDACTGDSTFMYKVSMLKVDISKELEKTESEIDSLEHELKFLDSKTNLVEAHQGLASLTTLKMLEPCSMGLELASLDRETKPVEAHQAQVPLATVKMSEPCSEITKDCNILVTEELVDCSEKQQDMIVDLKIKDHEGQEIDRCSVKLSTSDDNNLVLDEAQVLINSIVAANKEAARLAEKSIGIAPCVVDMWESDKVSCSRTDNLRIRGKLAVRKRQMKLKEQVLVLKFMALKQLWKEDMRFLDMKTNFTKSSKQVSLSGVPLQCVSQKPRSSVRARLPSPDDNSTLVPSTEILNYSRKLLSSSELKQYRSYQKMPSMIIDGKEKENAWFSTKNGLIEDPVFFERDQSMINPWTPEEKEVFMEMLATFGKNFMKISSFLDCKTTADCVEFYYKNHKSESFAEVRKRLLMKKKESQLKLQQLTQSSTFLVATSRKWSREMNAAALDILGAASVVAEYNQTTGSKAKQKVFGSKFRGNNSGVDRKEFVTANVPSSIGHAVSSEAMSSCVTTSTDPAGKTSHIRPVVEEDACSEESCGGELVSADWTDEEKALFVQAYNTHGKDFSKISHHLGTRSRDQCKVFFCKAQKSLGLDFSNHGEDNGDAGGTLLGNGDTNGERSDTDDGVAEMDSGICSTQSCSKAACDVATTSEALAEPGSENANDGTSEQEVVGGAVVKSEMYGCFPGKHETISTGDGYNLNEKPVPEEGKHGVEPVLDESENAISTCNGKESLPEVKEKNNLKVMIEQSRMDCVDADSVPVLHTTGTCSTYLCEDVNNRPIDTLNERVSSAHPVKLLHQTGTARSRRRASIDLGATSSVISFASDSGVSESLLSKPELCTNYLSQVPMKNFPAMLKENYVNNRSVHFSSGPTTSSSSSICFSGNPHGLSQTTLNFEEHLSKPHHNVLETDNPLQQYMKKNNPLGNQTNQSSHVLKGYPLQMPNHKATRDETDIFGHVKRSEFSQPNQFFGLNASNARYSSVAEIMNTQKRDVKLEVPVHPTSQPVCSTEHDAPCRTGDVKLFGKILTQSSSEKVCTRPFSSKPNPKEPSSMQSGPILSVQNGHSLSTPLFSRPVGGSVGNHLGLDAVQAQNHGFWDRDSVRPGFVNLPESAHMMDKHQDSLVGALPFYPGKDNNSSNVHVNLSNCQQPHMQQLTSNGGRVDGFSMTVPKRSGIEVVQQFAPNIVGSGAGLIRAGGVVSDPVVALKMLYSSNATVCSSNGSGMEAWSDVGR